MTEPLLVREQPARPPATIAELVRRHRTARALTQEELATRARLTAKAVGAIERGERRRPYPHTLRALADALGLDEQQRAEIFSVGRRDLGTADPSGSRAPGRGLGDVVRATGPVIGRAEDVLAVRTMLRDGTRPIVTLTGPGGVGKSTLARLAAGAAETDFPDGVLLVPLADVVDPGQVVGVVAAAVGVPSVGLDTGVEELAEVLLGRSMLLVLDNVEHLLSCAPLLADLVAWCPEVRLLVTSRRPLRVRPEQRRRVAPLSESDALVLLCERMSASGEEVRKDVARALCRRTDGLPLALELAASAASYLGPDALASRIDPTAVVAPRDLPARQRTMASTFEWSWALLGQPARSLLSRLSVCAGFSLASAEAIDVDGPAGSTSMVLVELLEHSLVVRSADVAGVPWFRLLEPIRRHAALRLAQPDREDAQGRLAHQTLAIARDLVEPLRSIEQAAALQTLDAEFANVRQSMEWFLAHSADEGAELLCRVWLHLALRRHIQEARGWAERLSAFPLSDLGRAQLLLAAAGVSLFTAPAQARAWALESLDLAAELGNERLVEEAAALAASAAVDADDLAQARDLLAGARKQHRTSDVWVEVPVLIAASQLALLADEPEKADETLVHAERIARGLGGPFEIGSVLTARASVLDRLDRPAEAASRLVEALDLCVTIDNSWTIAYTLSALGSIAVRLGEYRTAARLFGASAGAAAKHSVLDRLAPTSALLERDQRYAREELGDDVYETECRSGRVSRASDLLALARSLRESTEQGQLDPVHGDWEAGVVDAAS